jgi:hypothetical protein
VKKSKYTPSWVRAAELLKVWVVGRDGDQGKLVRMNISSSRARAERGRRIGGRGAPRQGWSSQSGDNSSQ